MVDPLPLKGHLSVNLNIFFERIHTDRTDLTKDKTSMSFLVTEGKICIDRGFNSFLVQRRNCTASISSFLSLSLLRFLFSWLKYTTEKEMGLEHFKLVKEKGREQQRSANSIHPWPFSRSVLSVLS